MDDNQYLTLYKSNFRLVATLLIIAMIISVIGYVVVFAAGFKYELYDSGGGLFFPLLELFMIYGFAMLHKKKVVDRQKSTLGSLVGISAFLLVGKFILLLTGSDYLIHLFKYFQVSLLAMFVVLSFLLFNEGKGDVRRAAWGISIFNVTNLLCFALVYFAGFNITWVSNRGDVIVMLLILAQLSALGFFVSGLVNFSQYFSKVSSNYEDVYEELEI